MKFHRLLIALTVFNLGLLVFLLAQIEVRFLGFRFLLRSPEVNSAGSVLRARGIEIIDDEGKVRASIKLHPASVLPDGTTFPETVLLRLIQFARAAQRENRCDGGWFGGGLRRRSRP
jgi:hypothetical protein